MTIFAVAEDYSLWMGCDQVSEAEINILYVVAHSYLQL